MYKRILVMVAFLLVIVSIVYYSNISFNDTPSMEAEIERRLKVDEVSIFDLQDMDEYRFAGYTYNHSQGYAVFKQNKKGDFLFEFASTSDRMISRAENIFNDTYISYWIVLSINEDLHSIEFKYNFDQGTYDKVIKTDVVDHPSINVMKWPEFNFAGEYLFYDIQGNVIR